MPKFEIIGGQPLSGKVEIFGAKNAAMKMMAAAILTCQPSILHNVPDILDIQTMQKILESLNVKIERQGHTVKIDPSKIKGTIPEPSLVRKMRGSVVLIGPILSRFGKVKFAHPGGCIIGARPIDTHLKAFERMGVKIKQIHGYYLLTCKKLIAGQIVLDEISVTATENIMMAAVKASGKTEIRLAAAEPEISDLALFLNKMGAKISGAGTNFIKISGVKKLNTVVHEVIPDRIEAGTFALAAAVSKGNVEIKNVVPEHLDAFLRKLELANVNFEIEDKSLHIFPTTIFKPVTIDTRPYPGFPTDLQAPFAILLTQAKGTSRIFETLFEGRLNYLKELNKMGSNAKIINAHEAVITGPSPLYGKKITTLDLRAGATLILAALIAQGKSEISKVQLIDRGYEKIESRLASLGAKIKRVG